VSTPEDKKIGLKDVFISIHDPKYIIRLETERFKTCLGYLVFPKIDPNLAQNAAMLSAGNQTVDGLCADIINQIHDKLKATNDKIQMSDELRLTIMTHLASIKKNEDLKVRYVQSRSI